VARSEIANRMKPLTAFSSFLLVGRLAFEEVQNRLLSERR
jgi:hypothetical protein